MNEKQKKEAEDFLKMKKFYADRCKDYVDVINEEVILELGTFKEFSAECGEHGLVS